MQACWCYSRKAISITVRTGHSFLNGDTKDRLILSPASYDSGYKPKEKLPPFPVLNTQKELCDAVNAALSWKSDSPQSGLLVVSGSTKSMKSVDEKLRRKRFDQFLAVDGLWEFPDICDEIIDRLRRSTPRR